VHRHRLHHVHSLRVSSLSVWAVALPFKFQCMSESVRVLPVFKFYPVVAQPLARGASCQWMDVPSLSTGRTSTDPTGFVTRSRQCRSCTGYHDVTQESAAATWCPSVTGPPSKAARLSTSSPASCTVAVSDWQLVLVPQHSGCLLITILFSLRTS
jgi:hypothetical protein